MEQEEDNYSKVSQQKGKINNWRSSGYQDQRATDGSHDHVTLARTGGLGRGDLTDATLPQPCHKDVWQTQNVNTHSITNTHTHRHTDTHRHTQDTDTHTHRHIQTQTHTHTHTHTELLHKHTLPSPHRHTESKSWRDCRESPKEKKQL